MQAILHSFQMSGVAMVDHNMLMQHFWDWRKDELRMRGYSPGNWKWIMPPVIAHTSPCYLGLNTMTEYTLKPALLCAPGYKRYAKAWFGASFDRHEPQMKAIQLNPFFARWVGRIRLRTSMKAQLSCAETTCTRAVCHCVWHLQAACSAGEQLMPLN